VVHPSRGIGDRYTRDMCLTTQELLDVADRLRSIDVELESILLRDIPKMQQISQAIALSEERTHLRRQLVADSERIPLA
jgi:hypothetical protein